MKLDTALRALLLAFMLAAAPNLALAQTDATLEPAAYTQYGMPPIDRAWTLSDFSAASVAIQRLPEQHLPHWRGSRSSPVFARLVDLQNVAPCRASGQPVQNRLQACLQVLEGYNTIIQRYAQVSGSNRAYLEETAPIISVLLELAAEIRPASLDFVAPLDPNDPTYSARMDGFAQMNHGMLMIAQGGLMMLIEERALYSNEACIEVARSLARAYPVLAGALAESDRPAMEARLRQVATTDPNADVRAALVRWAT